MQVKKIVSLCTIAFAAMAGQAHAAMLDTEKAIVDDAVANGRVIFISGASATQKGFTGIISTMFSGTPVRFADTTASSKNYEAVAGKLAAAAGGWAAGTNVIIIDRVLGGSVQGVNPVARETAIESLDVTSTTCGSAGSGTSSLPYVCTTTPAAGYMVPDAGVSDVAPALFQSPYNTEGEEAALALDPTELALLTATPIYGLAFGVPVTNNLPLFDLNKAAVSSIMTGNVGTWNQVNASLPADDIVVCRRVPGSGTQAVDNLYFGSYPCSTEFNVPADRNASGAWDPDARTYTVDGGSGGLVVIENSTSGDVRNCLNKAVEAKTSTDASGYVSYTGSDRDGNAVTVKFKTGVDHKAIGVLSMDSLKDSKTTAAGGKWQFRSLDGAGIITWDNTSNPVATSGTGKFPTLASYLDGTWDLQGWISFNVPTRTTGNKKAVLDQFLVKAQDPAILASITDLKNVAAAIPGGAYTTGQVLRAKYLNNNQCAPLNRKP